MRQLNIILFSIGILFSQNIQAQDIHWTMFDMSPMTLNPANTGAYEGTYRVGGIYRDQFNSITNATGFRTPSFYIDAPIVRGFNKSDWVGIGAVLYNDQAGSGQLNTLGTFASVAYHLRLREKGNIYLTLGLQGGLVQRRIDPLSTDFLFEDELFSGGQISSPNRMILDENKRFFDLNTGLILSGKLSEKTSGKLGIAFRHLNQPDYNLISSESEKLPMRITAFGSFDFNLSNKWVLSPSVLLNKTDDMNESVIQALVGYQLNEDLTVRFGMGYRVDDAVAPIARVDYKQLRFGFSYDITTSNLSEINNSQGSFEFGVSYIIRKFKKLETKPVIFCPHF